MSLTVSFRAGSLSTSDFDLLIRQSFETKVSIPTNNDDSSINAVSEQLEKVAALLKANASQVAQALSNFGANPSDAREALDQLGLNDKALSPNGMSASALIAVALALITVPGTPG